MNLAVVIMWLEIRYVLRRSSRELFLVLVQPFLLGIRNELYGSPLCYPCSEFRVAHAVISFSPFYYDLLSVSSARR